MIKHFVQKYGIDYVRQWNFESWNEPDHHIHNPFGRNNNTTYLNYLEATWNALLEVSFLDFDQGRRSLVGTCPLTLFLDLY